MKHSSSAFVATGVSHRATAPSKDAKNPQRPRWAWGRMLLVAVASLLLCVRPGLAVGAWSTDSTVNSPISTVTNSQLSPSLASDGSGGAIVVWQDNRSGPSGNSDIYAQRLDASGTVQWSIDGVPISRAANAQSLPAVVADGSGGAIIAWNDVRSDGVISYIYAQRINANGVVQWTADGVLVTTGRTNSQYSPQIVTDGNGGAIISWWDGRYGNSDVFAQKINASGAIQWTTNGVPLTTAGNGQENHTMTSDGSGGALVTWRDNRNSMSGASDIYAQRINASGLVQWASDGVAVSRAANSQTLPTIASDGSGGAIIAWNDQRGDGVISNIYAQRINASGVAQWITDGVLLTTSRTYTDYPPKLVSDGGGGAIVAWWDGRYGNSDIFAQRINASGTPLWAANGVPLSTAANGQEYPSITSDGSGGAIVVWQDNRNSMTGSSDIYAQRINVNGAAAWTPDGLAISRASNVQSAPVVVDDGNGGAIIAWTDYRTDGVTADIYGQRVSADGVIGPTATVPGAPTGASAVAGNAQATVTFSAPASNGGSAVVTYTVTASPGGLSGTGSASPITITGLTNGTDYTFTVTATNSVGVGAPSNASNRVTPALPSIGKYLDNSNGTVTDPATGLVWMRCSMGQTWTGSTCSGTASTYTNVLTGTLSFAGLSDWYLPSITELRSIIDTSYYPTINPTAFPNTPASIFWSSTESGYGSTHLFAAFYDGASNIAAVEGPVRLVRNGQSVVTFTTLSVILAGTGSGTIASNPSGIACGTSCSASFNSGTSVTLTATPASGSSFTGWSGACNGTDSCVVSMNSAQSVTATFAPNVITPPILTGISLSVSSIGVGSAASILATPTGAVLGTCSSTNPVVATVVGSTVTAVAIGVTTIQCGAFTTAAAVVPPTLTGITLAASSLTVGSTTNITPLPSQAALGTCTSSNTAVASISGAEIQAIGAGSAFINCGNASAALTVSASTLVLADLILSCPVTIAGGGADSCSAMALYTNSTTRLITAQWKTDNTVLAVDGRGSLSASYVTSNALVTLTATYTEGQLIKTKSVGVQVLASVQGACTGTKPFTMLLTINGKVVSTPLSVKAGDPVEIDLCMANFDGNTLLDIYVAFALAGANGAPQSWYFAAPSSSILATIQWFPWDGASAPNKFMAKQGIQNLNPLQIAKFNIPPTLPAGTTAFYVQAVFAGKQLTDTAAWSTAWSLGVAAMNYQP